MERKDGQQKIFSKFSHLYVQAWCVFFALLVCVPLEQCHERTTPRCLFFKNESDEALLPQLPPPTSERRCARRVVLP